MEQADMTVVFQAGNELGIGPAALADIIHHLEETYCQSIGIEYVYMREPDRIQWFKEKIELKNRPKFTADDKKRIFSKLNKVSISSF